jgi:hypothetical protein
MIGTYQKTLNKMANLLLDNYFLENGLHTAKDEIVQTTIIVLTADFPEFVWHYSKENGIWHTLKIKV